MNYRDALKAAGKIDDNHEANFVLFALVPQDDPGLLRAKGPQHLQAGVVVALDLPLLVTRQLGQGHAMPLDRKPRQ